MIVIEFPRLSEKVIGEFLSRSIGGIDESTFAKFQLLNYLMWSKVLVMYNHHILQKFHLQVEIKSISTRRRNFEK